MPFQPTNFPVLFDGVISDVKVGSPFPASELIIDVRDNWTVDVSWKTSGFLATAIGGTWQVKAFLESMGVGFEGQVGQTNVPATGTAGAPGSLTKNATINVLSANALGIQPGAYKLVVTLTHVNPGPTGVAAYSEGTIVQFVTES